nr:E3 ubiquitin-protein ligase UPL1-like [Tanacetum cinerariifolium]
DHGTPSGTSVGGKTRSALQRLLAGAVLNAEVGVVTIPTLPFVTASVSTTLEREGGDHTDSVADLNLHTIGAPRRSSVSIMTTVTTITSTVDPTLVDKEKLVEPSPFGVGSSSAGGTDLTTSQDNACATESKIKQSITSSSQSQTTQGTVTFPNFTEKHAWLLNAFVRQDPGMLEKSLSILLKARNLMDFDNKRSFFLSRIRKQHEQLLVVPLQVAKALFDGKLLDVYFTRSFYKHILVFKVTYHNIEVVDPDYYKNLKWMLEILRESKAVYESAIKQWDEYGFVIRPVVTSFIQIESHKSPTISLFDVDSSRISIFIVNT